MLVTDATITGALGYVGEEFCANAKAWPNGSYWGQMHPFLVQAYRAHAARTGHDVCELWALNQRHSAVAGLRALGYTVFGPAEFAWPQPEIEPVVSIDPTLLRFRDIGGYGSGSDTLELLPGIHTMRYSFGHWGTSPATVTYEDPSKTWTVVHDGPVSYGGRFTIVAPVAGAYQFTVQTSGTWRLSIGERPESNTTETGLPSVEACEALLFPAG